MLETEPEALEDELLDPGEPEEADDEIRDADEPRGPATRCSTSMSLRRPTRTDQRATANGSRSCQDCGRARHRAARAGRPGRAGRAAGLDDPAPASARLWARLRQRRDAQPGFGRQRHRGWGLGFKIRTARYRTEPDRGPRPGTFGHRGRSGSFLWADPQAGSPEPRSTATSATGRGRRRTPAAASSATPMSRYLGGDLEVCGGFPRPGAAETLAGTRSRQTAASSSVGGVVRHHAGGAEKPDEAVHGGTSCGSDLGGKQSAEPSWPGRELLPGPGMGSSGDVVRESVCWPVARARFQPWTSASTMARGCGPA